MRDLRPRFPALPQEDAYRGLPSETQYADDLDFLSFAQQHLEQVLEVCSDQLPEWSLQVNRDETERTHIYLAPKGSPDHGNEAWRKMKTLGTRLDCAVDLQARINLAQLSMRKLQGMWGTSRVNLAFKVRLYNAYIRPILLYNSGTWGLTKFWSDKLDATHRRHLRRLVQVFYPNCISNGALYTKCDTHPLSWDVRLARWHLLGHMLRLPPLSPAQAALDLYIMPPKLSGMKGRVGRHQTGLMTVIRNELCTAAAQNTTYRNLKLSSPRDLDMLRRLATDRGA